MKVIFWLGIICAGLLLCAGCGKKTVAPVPKAHIEAPPLPPAPEAFADTSPVIGVASADFYSEVTMTKPAGALQQGTKIKMLNDQVSILNVSLEDGRHCYIWRGAVCTPEELKRRQDADEVPASLSIIDAAGGTLLFKGGNIQPEVGADYELQPGMAIWVTKTASGSRITYNKQPYTLDTQSIVYYHTKKGVLQLPVWTGS